MEAGFFVWKAAIVCLNLVSMSPTAGPVTTDLSLVSESSPLTSFNFPAGFPLKKRDPYKKTRSFLSKFWFAT